MPRTSLLAILALAALVAAACSSSSTTTVADDVSGEVASTEGSVDAAVSETTDADTADAEAETTTDSEPAAEEPADADAETETEDDEADTTTDEEADESAAYTLAPSLPTSDFLGEYEIVSEEYGTEVRVTLTDDMRVMITNALPPWEAGEFPEGNNTELMEQDIEYQLPLAPTFVGNQSSIRTFGVSIAGIKFDAGTAQVARCENGVQYRVEAVQDLIPFGLDANNAHVQNDGTYHYHDVPLAEIDGDDPEFIGWAFDGHRIFYSPTNEYASSFQLRTEPREGENCTYSEPDLAEMTFDATPDGTFGEDWEFVAGSGDLDECNGIEIDGEYVYFLTDEYPLVPRCLNGETPGGGGGGGEGGERGARPEPREGEGGERPPRPEGEGPEGEAPAGE